jgi:hydroxymethylbilane synthase
LNDQFQIRIATRTSELAIWQSNLVASLLRDHQPKLQVELVKVVTEGDRKLDTPLSKIGGKSLFIKELEVAILEGRADIAVHSMKDVPNQVPDQFSIIAILEREDCRDVLLSQEGYNLENLPAGAVVGTSSLRRKSQLLSLRPDLSIRDLRGNVPTRVEKQRNGDFDAIVLASAGLKRLGLHNSKAHDLSVGEVMPAVGQGAIGIEALKEDQNLRNLVSSLNNDLAAHEVFAERTFSRYLNGSCQSAIGALAKSQGENLMLEGIVGSPDGRVIIRKKTCGPRRDPEEVGNELGRLMREAGADELLKLS